MRVWSCVLVVGIISTLYGGSSGSPSHQHHAGKFGGVVITDGIKYSEDTQKQGQAHRHTDHSSHYGKNVKSHENDESFTKYNQHVDDKTGIVSRHQSTHGWDNRDKSNGVIHEERRYTNYNHHNNDITKKTVQNTGSAKTRQHHDGSRRENNIKGGHDERHTKYYDDKTDTVHQSRSVSTIYRPNDYTRRHNGEQSHFYGSPSQKKYYGTEYVDNERTEDHRQSKDINTGHYNQWSRPGGHGAQKYSERTEDRQSKDIHTGHYNQWSRPSGYGAQKYNERTEDWQSKDINTGHYNQWSRPGGYNTHKYSEKSHQDVDKVDDYVSDSYKVSGPTSKWAAFDYHRENEKDYKSGKSDYYTSQPQHPQIWSRPAQVSHNDRDVEIKGYKY